MSTRRARIKAVTSLPPRRKNIDNNPKPGLTKEDAQKPIKSPGTPRSVTRNLETTKTSPALLPQQGTPNLSHKINSPQTNHTEIPKPHNVIIKTPKVAEHIVVNTASSSIKSIFASPPPRTDSPMKSIASPLVSSLRFTPKLTNTGVNKSKELADTETHTNSKSSIDKYVTTVVDNKSDTPDDYNVPSVPESITEETVMDGIVPLRPARAIPKPIDLLKNEIISENAEVLFDPIVPLPSPSKVRPKLRPIPRLAPLRRNSIQGSASESEDETRRALLSSGANTPAPSRQRHDSHTSHNTLQSVTNRDVNRIRNDSVSSSISQVTVQPHAATSPVKEKHNKHRRQDVNRRMAAMRRRRETVKRDELTMYDLIFYNPTTNPIIPDQDELKAIEANKRDEAERAAAGDEEDVDDPPPADEAPVPQIKLGPNGEIILDEKSLVIKPTDNRRVSSSVVREGAWVGGGGKYTRSTRTADWSSEETVRFYRALAALGTDFTLMVPLFPDRTRRDLKIKFKKEEKVNGAQVDKALRSATTWDAVSLQEEFQQERAAAAAKAAASRERLMAQKKEETKRVSLAKQQNFRRSRGSKAVEVVADRTVPIRKHHEGPVTANEILQRALEDKAERIRKQKESTERRAAEIKRQIQLAKTLTPKAPIVTATPLSASSGTSTSTLEMATLSKLSPANAPAAPFDLNSVAGVPKNIESGSLVVLTVRDPNSATKKMLQTYVADDTGQLTPVSLPPSFLNTVVGYMKKGTPKSTTSGSPQLSSPVVPSTDSRMNTPGVIQYNPSPVKRQRHSSYTVTQL